MTGKLIDVEATIETLSKDPLFPLVEKYGLSTVLEAMPTVEAIPVEWIDKWCWEFHDDPYPVWKMIEHWKAEQRKEE